MSWRVTTLTATVFAATCLMIESTQADHVDVRIFEVSAEGTGEQVGEIRFRDIEHGLLITPDLKKLSPGPHGLHVHESPSCEPSGEGDDAHPAGSSGGHFDPAGAGQHAGPYGDGHLGDLPNLIVEADGSATIEVLAPRLDAVHLEHRAIMIHGAADRYGAHHKHDHGSGGPRMYCGVAGAVVAAGDTQ